MAETMLAVEAGGGGLSDLQTVRRPAPPPPGPGEVTVQMLAMSINPADLLMLEGRYGVRLDPPFVPGAEGVGRVIATGPDAPLPVGRLVVPMPTGAWVSHKTLKARQVVALPDGVDVAQAAMLKANPATALAMLSDVVPLQPGDWVVQNAANSAVGQNVVRIGRALGLRVGCVVRRPGAAEALQDLAPDALLVDDGSGPPPALPDGAQARLAFDAVGGPATERLAGCLADGGVMVTYGLLSGQSPRLSAHDLVFRGLSLRGFWLAHWFRDAPPARVAEVYGQLVAWLQEGRIGARVAARYPLDRVAEAVAHAARAERAGKILLTAPEA